VPMDQGNCELQPLPLTKRKRIGQHVHDLVELEAARELRNSAGNRLFRQLEQTGMQLEVLANSQLAVEREVLRHVADAPSGLDVVRIDLLPKEPRLALTGREQTSQHFHGGCFSAAVRPQKAENFSAGDAEGHMIDG